MTNLCKFFHPRNAIHSVCSTDSLICRWSQTFWMSHLPHVGAAEDLPHVKAAEVAEASSIKRLHPVCGLALGWVFRCTIQSISEETKQPPGSHAQPAGHWETDFFKPSGPVVMEVWEQETYNLSFGCKCLALTLDGKKWILGSKPPGERVVAPTGGGAQVLLWAQGTFWDFLGIIPMSSCKFCSVAPEGRHQRRQSPWPDFSPATNGHEK